MRHIWRLFRLILVGIVIAHSAGCSKEPKELVIYAGKGLKFAVDEIVEGFSRLHNVRINLVYAGSDTLLTTLQMTHKGDIFIPGSAHYVKEAGELVTEDHYLAMHVPLFVVRTDNPRPLNNYSDLLLPGVRIAIGNKDMNAIGRIAESMMSKAPRDQDFRSNVVVTAATVNELLQLVIDKEVDAALVWEDMLEWKNANGLEAIAIPAEINQPKEIRVAVLASSHAPKTAKQFAQYAATEGRKIFEKHGFGKR